MRLLKCDPDGSLTLMDDITDEKRIPPYAILSHTWLDGEVTFDDLKNDKWKNKAGYRKIHFCMKQALRDGLEYCWVDTCCIDKSSSAELTEALNSMFKWYKGAVKCYVYLPNVSLKLSNEEGQSISGWMFDFRASRWFTRGWTLQELLAPEIVEFYSIEGELLGNKESLTQELREITNIPIEALHGSTIQNFSLDERFSWTENRQTTRPEDEAYCLLGIFNISIPVIYGEGKFQAKKRLFSAVQEPSIDQLKSIKKDTQHVSKIHTDVEAMHQNQLSSEHLKILEWISSSDYPAQQSDIIARRQKGTGRWFLETPEFKEWLETPGSTLFCPGNPGAGKTMLAATAIKNLLDLHSESSFGVAYVFCDYKNENQDASHILSAILKQLGRGQPSNMAALKTMYDEHSSRGTKPTTDQLASVFNQVLLCYSRVFIVIDALDECQSDARSHVLAKLEGSQGGQDVRVMATSRPLPEIVEKFEEDMQLVIKATNEDVKLFVTEQMCRLPKCIQQDMELQSLVQEKITESVDGMFLLARLYVDSLLAKRTRKAVAATLNHFRKDSTALENAYGDALKRINSQLEDDRNLGKRVLSWITFAKRPFKTSEICCALAVEPGTTALDSDNVLSSDDIVSVCSGLVIVDQESDLVRLVHYTTQDYLENTIDALQTHSDIAKTCLTYLSFDVFSSGCCETSKDLQLRFEENVFSRYAAGSWDQHTRAAEVEDDVFAQACNFFLQKNLCNSTTQMTFYHHHSLDRNVVYQAATTGLHLAVEFGLRRLAQYQMQGALPVSLTAVEARNDYDQTPLHIAASKGYADFVELLVSHGATVDVDSEMGGTPLQAAAWRGFKQIVEMLLYAGADVNYVNEDWVSALMAASDGGHEKVVEELLAAGADVNYVNEEHGSALIVASDRGYEKVVEELLAAGADINYASEKDGTALTAASAKGYKEVVEVLLAAGADVNYASECHSTALTVASGRGYEEVVKVLLAAGADVNYTSKFHSTALMAASGAGQKEVVEVLLAAGANVTIIAGWWQRTALDEAVSSFGNVLLVRMLLDATARLDRASSDLYGRALRTAANRGNKEMLKFLLDARSQFDAKSVDLNDLLEASLKDPSRDIFAPADFKGVILVLLDLGADAKLSGWTETRSLWAAVEQRDDALIKVLLEAEAASYAASEDFKNRFCALHIAAWLLDLDAVHLLLKAGASVNNTSELLGCALEAAISKENEVLTKLLLEKGADVDIRISSDTSILHKAARRGNKEIVTLLADKGRKCQLAR